MAKDGATRRVRKAERARSAGPLRTRSEGVALAWRLMSGGGVPLERPRLVGARGDRDLARLPLLGLRDPYLEHAVREAGVDGLGVDAAGQRQRAGERAEGALHPVEALAVLLVVGLALTGHRQHVVLELDRHVLLAHAGQVGAKHEVILGLEQVHGRAPAARTAVAHRGRLEHGVEQPVLLGLERAHLAKRLPANDGHVSTPFVNSSTGSDLQLPESIRSQSGSIKSADPGRTRSQKPANVSSSASVKWR